MKKQIALIKQLLYLGATIRNGKISQTAEENGMKASNLSSFLKELEGQLGIQLITRLNDGVEPTELGLQFRKIAENIEKVLNDVENMQKTLAISPTLNFYLPKNLAMNIKKFEYDVNLNHLSRPQNYDVAILPSKPSNKMNLYSTKVVIESNCLQTVWWVVSTKNKPLAEQLHKFLVNSMM